MGLLWVTMDKDLWRKYLDVKIDNTKLEEARRLLWAKHLELQLKQQTLKEEINGLSDEIVGLKKEIVALREQKNGEERKFP